METDVLFNDPVVKRVWKVGDRVRVISFPNNSHIDEKNAKLIIGKEGTVADTTSMYVEVYMGFTPIDFPPGLEEQYKTWLFTDDELEHVEI